MKLNSYFKEFTSSAKYEEFLNITKSDLEIIMAQIFTYKEDIDADTCSSAVRK
jgi:hypothetical protein